MQTYILILYCQRSVSCMGPLDNFFCWYTYLSNSSFVLNIPSLSSAFRPNPIPCYLSPLFLSFQLSLDAELLGKAVKYFPIIWDTSSRSQYVISCLQFLLMTPLRSLLPELQLSVKKLEKKASNTPRMLMDHLLLCSSKSTVVVVVSTVASQ